jgi:hypothetical protein
MNALPHKAGQAAIFPGQRTKTPTNCNYITGLALIMPDSASCYTKTQEALLFRLHFLKKKAFLKRRKRGA